MATNERMWDFKYEDHPWWWRQHVHLKRRSTIILHGSTSQKTILNERMLSEWWIGKGLEGSDRGLILTCYPGNHLKEMGKTTKACQNIRSPGRNLNMGPPKYETGVITTLPRRSVNPRLLKVSMTTTIKKINQENSCYCSLKWLLIRLI
jgi:hypothetical protein